MKVKTVKPANEGKSVTWKSSNSKVAKVSSKGKVTAKKAGLKTAGIVDSYSVNQKEDMKETGDLFFETFEGAWESFEI